MNILLVAQNYHPFVGGVEIHARQVAQELSKRHCLRVAAVNFAPMRLPRRLANLHTNLLAPSYADYKDGDVPIHALTPTGTDRLRMLPIAARVVPLLPRLDYHALNRFGYRWYQPVYASKLRALMADVDVVHSLAGGYLGWTAQATAKELRIPFVCTPFVHPNQWGDGPEDIEYYQGAQAVIGLVETDRAYLESLGLPAKRLHTIGVSPELPPSSDPEGFRKRHLLEGKPVVLYAGRMMPQKGAKSLLEAAPHVWKRVPEVRFVFIGPGSSESDRWFEGADPRILPLGKVSLQEKADALAACDLFCMPSLSEILPTVYLEAWSYGKPVVGGMAHGLPELVEGNGAGLAVSQNAEEIGRALISLLEDEEKRECMGRRGRDLVQRRYSVEAVTEALEDLYRSLLDERCKGMEA